MTAAVDRLNRIVLALLELGLVVGGVSAWCAAWASDWSAAWAGSGPVHRPVVPAGSRLIISDEWWLRPAGAVVCLGIALLCLW